MFVHTKSYEFNDKLKIHISEEIISTWRSQRQLTKSKNEAFGALIGSQSETANEFWLETCTIPQKSDSATRTSFVMRDPHHQKLVESYYYRSNGEIGYVGTWHTHPEPTPTPSTIDIMDWKDCMNRNPDRVLIFAIVGQEQACIFKIFNGTFKLIFKEKIDG